MQASANPAPGFAKNPDRKITLEPLGKTVTVKAGDTTLASSERAKLLREEGYGPIIYIPFADIAFATLERTTASTHCPYKGDASYWRAADQGGGSEEVMWAYEAPFDEMLAIKDHGAFYPERVSIETA